MPQLSVTDIVDGTGSLADKINAIIDALEAAYNKLNTTNFNSSSNIPNSALARPKAYFICQLSTRVTIPALTPTTTIQDEFTIPCNCSLAGVKVVANDVAGGAVLIDLHFLRGDPASPDYDQSILGSQISLAIGNPVKGTGAVSWSSFLENDVISLRAFTEGGETISILHATLLFKKKHTT